MASRQFEPGRAVEVISPTYGSAYRIGGRLVLTAAHLVAEAGSACQVRSKLGFGKTEARVVWKNEAADIALIELDASIESCDAVVLGRLPQDSAGESLRFQMYGYPRWGRTKREAERTVAGGRQIEGLIYLADSSSDGLLVLEPNRLPPEGSSTSGSEWEGNSGAAIVCDGLVIAVQKQHQNPLRPASLEASLLLSIDDDRQWRDLLERHGISLELAIARLQVAGATRQISAPYFYPRDLGSRTFVGRGEELQALHGLMQSSSQVGIVAATGMGGIGKTELAWQYAHQHRGDYPGGIWWLSAASLVGEVLVYGVRMELPEAPDQLEGDADRVQWYYDRWIEAIPEGKRLLVWDDVSDYGRVRSLLPQDERYRVLLTTRVKLGSPVQRLELGVLKSAEALELLGRLVSNEARMAAEAAIAPALCEWIGCLPLGIELVGRHLAGRPTVKLATLLERLKAQRLKAKAVQQVPAEMPYRDNLAAAFELSWQLLDESAQRLGGLLSVFALAPVQRSWMAASLSGWEEEELEEAAGELFRWSLMSIEVKSGAYLLHTLIREFFAEKLKSDLRSEAAVLQRGMAVAMVAEAETVDQTVTVSELARVQEAVPHWQVVVAEFTALLEGSDALGCFVALGRVAAGQSRWQEAEGWWQACLDLSEERFGKEHLNTASSLNNLAGLYKAQGRYSKAEPLLERSLSIREAQLGADHPDVAQSLNNLETLYNDQGRYSEAEPLYKRALSIQEAQLGADHPDVATSLNNLAEFYQSQGRYSEVEPLYKRALSIQEAQLGADHPDVATSLNNLAGLYQSQGRYSKAKPLYKRALSIQEAQLGAGHPNVAQSLNNLAVLYQSQGRYSKAKPLYKRALSIQEAQLGADHPLVAQSLNNLAELYHSQGHYSEAKPLYKRALSIREAKLGADHPLVAQSLNNLAGLYRSQGRYSEAEPLYKRALSIQETKLGADHPDVATSLNNLAGLYCSQGRHSEAKSLYKRALSIREAKLGPDHHLVALSLNNLAALYESQRRYSKAEPLYKRTLSIQEAQLGADHPNVVLSLNNLAALYESQGRYSEAEPLYKRTLSILEKVLPVNHLTLAIIRGNLKQLRSQLDSGA